MDERTRLLHAGPDRDPYTGASSVPIYQASTYAQQDPEHFGPYDYARSDNPTREAVETAIATLEGGALGLAFASGMAAISSALLLLAPGDHVIVSEDVYGGAYRVMTTVFRRWGLSVTFVDTTDPDRVRAALTPSTRALYVETPSNPLLAISDLAALAAIARDRGLLALVDNTFMTPYLQRPIALGFDIVLHSGTKFLGGHSDLVAGLAVARTDELGRQLKAIQNSVGAILGPQDSWLLMRGMKTLAARLDVEQRTAARVAEHLLTLPGVRRVCYPGLRDHPGRAVHERQARGPGAVLSFELESDGVAKAFLRALRLPLLAVSLGGVESIASYPATMSHAAMPPAERERRGITGGLVRLSVGLEAPEDLIADLEQALTQARARFNVPTPPTEASHSITQGGPHVQDL
jgi:cysteine-S-conjugate beta-lyase